MGTIHQENNTCFRGAERWTALIGGLGVVAVATGVWKAADAEREGESARIFVFILCVVGLWGVLTAIRHWRRPYVRFQDDTVVVFERNRPQYVDRRLIEKVSSQPHRTLLQMKDGLVVTISHLPFTTTQEVERFKARLVQFVDEAPTITGQRAPESAGQRASTADA